MHWLNSIHIGTFFVFDIIRNRVNIMWCQFTRPGGTKLHKACVNWAIFPSSNTHAHSIHFMDFLNKILSMRAFNSPLSYRINSECIHDRVSPQSAMFLWGPIYTDLPHTYVKTKGQHIVMLWWPKNAIWDKYAVIWTEITATSLRIMRNIYPNHNHLSES